MRFHIQTFGCKSNQYESQGIRERLTRAGWTEAPDPAGADVCIVNTCGVTGRAVASCRHALRRLARANPGARLVVTGCGVDLGEAWPEEAGRPLLVPNAAKADIPRLLAGDAGGRAADNFALSVSAFHGHTRAFLKIQDGCANFCTYCAVPHARGLPRSRAAADILSEAARLAAAGHGEVVLTGINIGAYRDGDTTFARLVTRLADTPGLARLRLGSVEPPSVTRELAAAMRHPRVCAHIHLPLQSGDDGVLAAMGRKYTASGFRAALALLRGELDRPAVGTDVIVGFPGEDEAAFARTLEMCARSGLARLHVFPFSARPGTPAAALPGRIPDGVVEERKNRLLDVGRRAAAAFARRCVGMRERVLLERGGGADAGEGLSDRYVRTIVPGRRPAGSVVAVRITAAADERLAAEALDHDG